MSGFSHSSTDSALDRYHDAALLKRAASAAAGQRIAVVGDAILDSYRAADGRSRCFAGGAAVIAGHLRQLGARPVLITPLSADGHAAQLRRCLEPMNVETVGIPTAAAQPIRVRHVHGRRITAAPRTEPCDTPTPDILERVDAAVRQRADKLDAVVFADFGHGTVTAELLDGLLPWLRPRVGLLTGDVSGPRPSLRAMRGFDLLTPTEREVRQLSGDAPADEPLDTLARRLVEDLSLRHLVVTRDAAGCVRYGANGTRRSLPSRASIHAGDTVDEVGAGDALLAAATLGLCGKLGIGPSVRLGQLAAAAALAQLGNAPVNWPRLHARLAPRNPTIPPSPDQRAAAAPTPVILRSTPQAVVPPAA